MIRFSLTGLLFFGASSVALALPLTQPCKDQTFWDFGYSGVRAERFTQVARALSPNQPAVDISQTAFVKGFFEDSDVYVYFLDSERCVLLGTSAPKSVLTIIESIARLIPDVEARSFFVG